MTSGEQRPGRNEALGNDFNSTKTKDSKGGATKKEQTESQQVVGANTHPGELVAEHQWNTGGTFFCIDKRCYILHAPCHSMILGS